MSAKITLFPGAELPHGRAGEGAAEGADPETVERLIELHRNYSSLPWDRFDSSSILSIQRAFAENRLRDGLDLIDIVVEGLGYETAHAADGDEDWQSPIPAAAQIFRLDSAASPVAEHWPRLVGSPAAVECLRPLVCLHSEASEDWVAESGSLSFNEDYRATLQLGLKGELVLVLFSGAIQVMTPDGDVIASVACEPGRHAMRQVVYCRQRDVAHPLVVDLRSSAEEPARGIWCHSSRLRLSAEDREDDPDNRDVFFERRFLPVEEVAESKAAFCTNALPLELDDYVHEDSVRRGELALFTFADSDFSPCEGWDIGSWTGASSIRGMQSGTPPAVKGDSDRPLVAHDGIELFAALSGATWVSITGDTPGGRGGSGEKSTTRRFLHNRHDDPKHLPAFVTALIGRGGTSHDVMLLKPSYSHAVWTAPGSDARFFHVCFSDPRALRPVKRGGIVMRDHDPGAMPGRRLAGGSDGGPSGQTRAASDRESGFNVIMADFRRRAGSASGNGSSGWTRVSAR